MQTHYEAKGVGWLVPLLVLQASHARRGDPKEGTLDSVGKDGEESHLSESFCVIPGELLEGSRFLPGDFFYCGRDS